VNSEFDKKKPKKAKKAKKKRTKAPGDSLKSEVEHFQDEVKKAQLQRARQEEDEDDKQIKFLMKKLGYNKRKTDAVPSILQKEGLDLLWDICDGNLTEDAAPMLAKDENAPLFDNIKEDHESVNDEEMEYEEQDNEGSEIEEDSEVAEESESESEVDESRLVEDIYGRMIDSKTGKVVKGVDTSKAQEKLNKLNEEDSELTEEKRFALTKSIRSILNRLNESTLFASVKSMQQILSSNSRNDVKQIFYETFIKTITTEAALTDRLVIEFAGFLLLVHQLVSSEISAHFVEKFTLNYLAMLANDDQERNSLRNANTLLAQIYNFKIIRSVFLFELMDKIRLIETPISLNMICDLLTYAGLTLKKRDGNDLNSFIARLHDQCEKMPKEKLEDDQIGFVVGDLLTTKNSKLNKFTEKFDRSFLEHYQKVVKGLTKHIEKKENEIGFSVDDILHVSERGRWWIVGSAFARNSIQEVEQSNSNTVDLSTKYDDSLLKLATKLKMNTELRKEIFCTIMSSSSLMDAFEKLVKLGKKDQQGREIIYILVICALHERVYNPFYANLIERFCEHKRSFQLTTQFAVWDRIKQLNELKKHQRLNLSTLIADLIWLNAAQLTILKVINFGLLDDATTTLLKRLMFRLLVKSTENSLKQLFERIMKDTAKNELLTHGLQLFFEVVIKEEEFADADELPIFKKRLNFVQGLLDVA